MEILREKKFQIINFCYFLVMATLNNVSLHTPMQIWSSLVKSFMAYMTMLDREVLIMTHNQIRGQMEVMLEADGFYLAWRWVPKLHSGFYLEWISQIQSILSYF